MTRLGPSLASAYWHSSCLAPYIRLHSTHTERISDHESRYEMVTAAVPSGRKVWTLVKLYAAVKDLPEIVPLVGLLGGTLCLASYNLYRNYFTVAGEHVIPSKEMRHDMEKQSGYYGQESVRPSILWRVAQWRRDPKDNTLDVGVWPFHNKDWKYDHVTVPEPLATPGTVTESREPIPEPPHEF